MIIAEAYEHTDDEIVTFDKIDMGYEFDKLNQTLFGGSLQRVPLSWSNRKGNHGHVSYRTTSDKTVLTINGLFLSKFFKIPYKMFKDTLAHEMIHVKNLQDDIRTNKRHYKNQAHGYDFNSEMNRINSLGLGFNISVRGEESFDVSDDIKGRNVYVALIKLNGATKSGDFIAVMVPKAFSERKTTIERIFNNLIIAGKYKSVDIEYYSTNNAFFLKYPVQRSFNRSIGYAIITPDEIEKVKSLATFIEKVNLGNDTATSQKDRERETREKSGFYSTLTKVDPPSFVPKTEPEPEYNKQIKPEPTIKDEPQISQQMKDQNKQIMAMFKDSTDQKQKEALFDLLKIKDENRREHAVSSYNLRFGKFGFIK